MKKWPASPRTSRHTLQLAATVAAVVAPLLVAGSTQLAAASGTPAPAGRKAGPAVVSCAVLPLPTLGGRYGDAIAAAPNGDVVGIADDAAGVARAVLWRGGKPQLIRTGLAGSVPTGINAHGDVVGNSPNGDATVGWVWLGHRTVRLRGAGDRTALPAAISDSGIIVGALETSEGLPNEGGNVPGAAEAEQAAVWWSPTGRPQWLAPLPGDQGAHAFAVGGAGAIGGVSEGTRFRPVVWDRAGKPHALPGLGGGYGIVRSFGPGGVAVGDAVARDGTDHPVMWDANGRIIDLGLPPGSRSAQASAVLPSGVVVGTAQMPAPGGGVVMRAVRWPGAGTPQLLGQNRGFGQSVVTGAAATQTAVGYRADAKGGRHPAIWRCA